MMMLGLGLGLPALAAWQALKGWSPSALWPTGTEPGMWIDPSNLTSQWQDSTGTTPVSTPGTVADSSNPVGLALDIRAGNPPPLGPEIWTDPTIQDPAVAVKIADRTYQFTGVTGYFGYWFGIGQTLGRSYKCSVVVTGLSSGALSITAGGVGLTVTSNGSFSNIQTTTDASGCNIYANGVSAGATVSVSVREIPGNHLLQATSTARPLLSAYDGQTLGPGNTYDATGYPVFQLYDGVDDGMATASFAAGTLTSAMDCMIAVRRDTAAAMVFGFHRSQGSNQFIAAADTGVLWPATTGAGTPTTYVNGVQLPGGTSTSAGDLHTALTVGDWHILELRGLDLSAWTDLRVGYYGSAYNFSGAFGGALLFPGGNAAGRDAARAWLANKVGVTL